VFDTVRAGPARWRRCSWRDDARGKGAGRAPLVLHEAPLDELGGAPNRNSDRPVASPPSSTLISLSRLTSRALLDLAVPRPPSTARSMPFDPAAVCLGCLSVPAYGSLCVFGCLQVEGWRPRGRARSWWASCRGHRDRDDGRQDADEEGAQQHRLDVCRRGTDRPAAEPSGSV